MTAPAFEVRGYVYANRRWGEGRLLQQARRLYCRLRGHRLGRWWEGTRRCERGCGGVALMVTCGRCLHPPHPGRRCGWCIAGTIDVMCGCQVGPPAFPGIRASA